MSAQYSSDVGNVAGHFLMLAGKISMYFKYRLKYHMLELEIKESEDGKKLQDLGVACFRAWFGHFLVKSYRVFQKKVYKFGLRL